MDELTEAQELELISALKSLKETLTASLKTGEDGVKPVDLGHAIGRISRIDAIQQQKMAAANRKSLIRRLQQVEAGLKRVKDGTYGECLICEDIIAFKRLSARPESPLCLECQSLSEKRLRRR